MVGLIERTVNLINKCPTIGKSGNYICTTSDIINAGGYCHINPFSFLLIFVPAVELK